MSLFGAMTSGVSGLAAQSSAMGAIADNITNVNTIGYKGTQVDFQTLVTKQASNTQYAAGGVQARPQGGVDVQGLLQSAAGQTDLAISGDGFFVVNDAAAPTASDQFLFTRAGSFEPDEQGFLRNTAGYYLQAWPTDAQGNVVPPSTSTATLTNQNIISTDFLETVNLNRVSGTAAATTEIATSANLPSTDSPGDSHNIDVQFFDTLGNSNAANFRFTKTAANQWELTAEPPSGTDVVTLSNSGTVYKSTGQLEFLSIPADGETVDIGGTTFTFEATPVAATDIDITSGNLSTVISNLVSAVNTTLGGGGVTAALKSSSSTSMVLNATGGALAVDPTGMNGAARQLNAFSVAQQPTAALLPPAITFDPTGVPSAFGVTDMSITGFANGAGDMDGTDSPVVTLDFGTVGLSDGFSQLGDTFSPGSIEQNGARFGTFSGVSIGDDGLVYALFDNGERRPIYQMPVVTFVNPNELNAATGNAWLATEASGNPTLREASDGPAGSVVQSSLESSTVDIGDEFTRMIIVQRAYSAATRIISTSDEMLEELVRIKR